MDEQTRQLIARLAERIHKRQCALFIGPDLGESAGGYRGLPNSWQLSAEMARRSDYRGRLRPLAQIAQIFMNRHGRVSVVQFLQDRLADPSFKPLPIHELIARLPFPIIVNGGWDTLLEQALSGQPINYYPVRSHTDLPFLLSGNYQLVLYKPYGSVDLPTSLLITEDDQLSIFFDNNRQRITERLKSVMEEYTLLFLGYAPGQDMVFVRLYYEIRQAQAGMLPLAVAVQSQYRSEDAATWEARNITVVVAEPVTFLWQLAEEIARLDNSQLAWSSPDELSTAPRLTPAEIKDQGDILNDLMDQIGVATLVEQTNVPLLSQEQLNDIEAMRAAYERLIQGFERIPSSAYLWLRLGNLDYTRDNYNNAESYYNRALDVDPNLAEAYHNLHYTYLAQRNWSKAMDSYRHMFHLQSELAIVPKPYQVDDVLGGGGTGVVYLATDSRTRRQVVIKVLHRAKAQTEQVLAFFKREAHILQDLNHPNIVQMLDRGSYHGNHYIVMPYLDGQSLREWLHNDPETFSLDRAFELTTQIGDALDHAHTAGVIHRDVKPSNILLVDDQAMLIDFGLAKPLTSCEQSTLGTVTGTITYLAPEMAIGVGGDARTDVFGLATVFYEMLVGRNPGQGTYRSPSELDPSLNSALDLTIEMGRESDPERRYPTVQAFLIALRQAVAIQPTSSYAPAILRMVASVARRVRLTSTRYWPVWLGTIVGFGFVLPALWPEAFTWREFGRYLAAGLAITLACGLLTYPTTKTLGHRVRNALIAVYGPLLGLIMGMVNSILALRSIGFGEVGGLGKAETIDYVLLLVATLAFSILVTALALSIISLGGVLTQRLGRNFTGGFYIAYILLMIVLLILGVSLEFAWLGEMDPPSTP